MDQNTKFNLPRLLIEAGAGVVAALTIGKLFTFHQAVILNYFISIQLQLLPSLTKRLQRMPLV